jgi:putative membrane protein
MHEMGAAAWAYLALLIIIVVAAGIFVVRWTWDRSEEDETAIDILKKRYARGEISTEEFERMKKNITGVES